MTHYIPASQFTNSPYLIPYFPKKQITNWLSRGCVNPTQHLVCMQFPFREKGLCPPVSLRNTLNGLKWMRVKVILIFRFNLIPKEVATQTFKILTLRLLYRIKFTLTQINPLEIQKKQNITYQLPKNTPLIYHYQNTTKKQKSLSKHTNTSQRDRSENAQNTQNPKKKALMRNPAWTQWTSEHDS